MLVAIGIAVVLALAGRSVRLSASAPHISRSGATARPGHSATREGWQADPGGPAKAGHYGETESGLNLRATLTGAATKGALTITLSRWSTDAERAPVIAALAAPPPVPAKPAPAAPAPAAGRGRGRGAPPPPPPSPFAKASAAIKAAPTLGYIWTDGVTGYSIKYAWRSPSTEDKERIVLVADRRLNSHAPDWGPAANTDADADFTVIEMRIDRQGVGEGKTSLTSKVAIDTEAKTLTLDGYASAPALLKVTR
jgi:hypothetical protein